MIKFTGSSYNSYKDMKRIQTTTVMVMLLITLNSFAQTADSLRLKDMVTTLASDDFMGRGFGSEGGRLAAAYIRDQFSAAGIAPFGDDYFQSFTHRMSVVNITGYNIVATIPGNDPELANEYIVLGAHYDHLGWEATSGDTIIYNGADDNASGVASIIEIGRILQANRDQLGRSVILVAFDGEESGLIGSGAFVDQYIKDEGAPLDQSSVVAMFSLDMVGMYDEHGGVDLQGVKFLEDHESLLADAISRSPVEITKSDERIPNRTDTAPFGRIGIPSIHVFTGLESPYHKPEDDSELLDYQGMAAVVDFMSALTTEISVAAEVQHSNQMEKISERGPSRIFNPAVTIGLGSTHHDYTNSFFEAKSVFASTVGLSFQTRLAEWISVQPEVLYQWSGSKVEGGKLKTHAVTVPLSLLFTTPDESGMGVRSYFQAGGYYSYAFAGNENGTALDFVNDYSDQDYGFVFGIGTEIMNVRFGYVYQFSITDFTLENNVLPADQYDVKLRGSYARIAVVF